MSTIWTNGKVAFAHDMIFGLCVMSEDGWFPVVDLTASDFKAVFAAWDYTPGNPYADDLIKRYLELPKFEGVYGVDVTQFDTTVSFT